MAMRRSRGRANDKVSPKKEVEESLASFRALFNHYHSLADYETFNARIDKLDEQIAEIEKQKADLVSASQEAPEKMSYYRGKVEQTEKLLSDIEAGKVIQSVTQAGRVLWESRTTIKARKLRAKLEALETEIEQETGT